MFGLFAFSRLCVRHFTEELRRGRDFGKIESLWGTRNIIIWGHGRQKKRDKMALHGVCVKGRG